MAIKQFDLNYDSSEDRLLFRLNTDTHEEYQFWLTRRISLFFLLASNHVVESSLQRKHSPETSKAIANFQKDTIAQSTNFQSSFVNGSAFPIGDKPILVKELKCGTTINTDLPSSSLVLSLITGENVTLKFSQNTLQTLYLLIQKVCRSIQWISNQEIQAQAPNKQNASISIARPPFIHWFYNLEVSGIVRRSIEITLQSLSANYHENF